MFRMHEAALKQKDKAISKLKNGMHDIYISEITNLEAKLKEQKIEFDKLSLEKSIVRMKESEKEFKPQDNVIP
jgi:hypothetical protein